MYVVATVLCLAVTFIHIHANELSCNAEQQLNGTVAVVTGGAKGIGRAIADNYLKNGAKTVIIVDINKTRGLDTEKDLNDMYGADKAVFMYGDITRDLDRVSEQIIKKYGYVDILVNSAGILNEYDPEKTIKTNALGTMLWAQRFFEYMRKDRGGKGGTIINIASVSAYIKDPFLYFYKASKYTVLGFTFSFGHYFNYLTSGVRIFAICPGSTRTDMTKKPQLILDEQVEMWDRFAQSGAWQSADDVGKAAALLYTTASTGVAYTVEGGEPPVVAPDTLYITVDYLNSI